MEAWRFFKRISPFYIPAGGGRGNFGQGMGMDRLDAKTYDEYIKALTDISKAITSELYLEDLLRLVVVVTAQAMGVTICSLWLVDEDENPPKIRLKATQAIAPEYVKDRALDTDEGVVGYVVTKKRPLVIKDVLRNKRFKEKEMARKLGLASMIGVPLKLKDDKVIGVLNCFTSSTYEFTGTEINLLTAVANQAAVAILNTELMVKTRVIQEELEARKVIDRAKEVLMKQRGIDIDEAYRWIRKRSMDSRKSIRSVAEAILLSDEMYHG